MKKTLLVYGLMLLLSTCAIAQTEPTAGNWKPWFIESGKAYRLPPPPSNKEELAQVLAAQRNLDAASKQKIIFWNAGAPNYRWHNMMAKLWSVDPSGNGAIAQLLLGTATYDATIAAWDTKYAYNRERPFAADNKVKLYAQNPESPSYPCEHSVAAGVAVTIISKFYPAMADSAKRMAEQVMLSRIAAGLSFPSDTRAGFDLGKAIAERELEFTKDFVTKKQWDGKMPDGPGIWKGKFAMLPLAGLNKTVVLDSASQYRPGPPPDFTKEMEELKNFKQTFSSKANAFRFAAQNPGDDMLNKLMFEYNLQLNPPRAARVYAALSVANYDAFTACWDAKYAYWGIRPDQFDPTYKPLMMSPPFPGYPSGHATLGGALGELLSYFFPAEKEQLMKMAKDGAESRFHAGIHFRTDNDAGLEIGKKVAAEVIERLKSDGADGDVKSATLKKIEGQSGSKKKP
jgi:membrane-associated phospholipid phosphatase